MRGGEGPGEKSRYSSDSSGSQAQLDSPDRAVLDPPPIVWPSAGVKAAGHLQCLGTQLWVGTAPGSRMGI